MNTVKTMMQVWFVAAALVGCDPSGAPGEGLLPTVQTGGPVVMWDIEATPLPEIPLPNNAATRYDASTATGRRLNFSEEAPTEVERRARRSFNTLDGFGTFAPVTVRFDAPLDLNAIVDRHGTDPDFRDDVVYLLNVDPTCEDYGDEVALDLGGGRFPVTHLKRGSRQPDANAPLGYRLGSNGAFFEYDAQADSNNLLFSDRFEDVNGDGILQPGEDLDLDGVMDEPNFVDPHACDAETPGTVGWDRCVADNLLTWYERETDTLILRPLWPLEAGCTHAVVLTSRLTDEQGRAVVSPFPYVNAREQTQDLAPVAELMDRYALGLEDIAFAWTFTTGTVTADLEALRAGLYGHGPFARLSDSFPVTGFSPWTRGELAAVLGDEADPDVAEDVLLDGACVGNALTWLWGRSLGEWPANMCAIEADLSSVGSIFGGQFTAPDLLVDRDGGATAAYPGTSDEVWEMNAVTGEAIMGSTEVTFWCALPQELDTSCEPGNPTGTPFCKPYPVIIYGHGYGGARAEISLHMGRHTAMGYALCGLDYYGHGLNVWRQDPAAALGLATAASTFEDLGVPELPALMTLGRDRDLDNDGIADPGADMWTADAFHTRDMVRQAALEGMQFVRILRSMDGVTEDGEGALLGDLDNDGQVDIGGPDNTIGAWGISLGGIVTGVLSGAEPSLNAASPNAGGAGLADIGARSVQAGVPQAVVLPLLGPTVVGCVPADDAQNAHAPGEVTEVDCHDGRGSLTGPYETGQLRLMFLLNDRAQDTYREFATVDGVAAGDRVELVNLRSGEIAVGRVNERGWLRLSVAADALDPVTRRPLIGLVDDDDVGPGSAEDNEQLGDALQIVVYDGDSDTVRDVVETFAQQVDFQGTRYTAGSTLVAPQEGLGHHRNTPELRRFLGFAQSALSAADPGEWAAHAFMRPLDVSYDPNTEGGNTRLLVMPTVGDAQVPVNTGIAMARAAGVLGSWDRDESLPAEAGWRALFVADERLGTTPDDLLVARHVVEGDPRFERYGDHAAAAPGALYDIDNVSDGTAAFSCGDSDWSAVIGENGCVDDVEGKEVFFDVPNPEDGQALRWDLPRGDGTYDALRVPMLRPVGQHGIYNAQSFRVFDADAFMVNFTVRYLGSRGAAVSHEAGCDCSASALPAFTVYGEPDDPGLAETCTEDDMKVCDAECADRWGIETPVEADCNPG